MSPITKPKGPANSTTARGGAREYTWPATGEKFVSVTTAIGVIDKPALRSWVGKSVATYAVENLAQVSAVAAKDPEGAIELLKGAPWRQSTKAANIGSAVHAAVEALVLERPMPEPADELKPFMVQFADFLEAYKPRFEMSEATVYSREHGYAGTLDSIAVIELPLIGGRYLLDVKTGKGVYPEAALQMSAYARGEFIGLPDGTEAAWPAIDAAAVVHLRPDSFELIPVRIDAEIFATFLSALDIFQAKKGESSWIGSAIKQGAMA
jgi:hypothetical protein